MLGIDFMDKNKIIPLKDLEEDSQRLESTLEKTVRKLRELMRTAGAAFSDTGEEKPFQAYIRTAEYFEKVLGQSLQSLARNWGKLKAALLDAVTPIAAVVVPVIDRAAVAVTGLLQCVGQLMRALLGGIFQTDSLGDSTQKTEEKQKKLAKTVKSTGKAVKRSLAGFDELERLNAPTGGSSIKKPTAGETVKAEEIALLELFKGFDLTPLTAALERLKAAMDPLTAELFAGLSWAWETIFVPLGKWTVEDFLPAFLDTLTAALSALNAVITALKPMGQWLWDNFLKPLAQWTGGVILEALGWLKEKLDGISKWISENQELVQKIAGAVLAVVAAVTLLNLVTGAFQGIGNSGAGAANLFGNSMGTLLNPMNLVVLGIVALIAAIVLLMANWDKVSAKATEVWNNIRGPWEKAYSWFKVTVLDPLRNGVKSMANGIIGYINAMVSGAVRGINGLIRAINALSFTVPSWVPGIGGKKVDYNLKTVTVPQIPYLAKGAVLPANKPFMAMVGDQRHGTNIEAPLSTIQEAVANVMGSQTDAILTGFEMSIGVQKEILSAVLGINIGDDAIANAVNRYNAKMAVVRGV